MYSDRKEITDICLTEAVFFHTSVPWDKVRCEMMKFHLIGLKQIKIFPLSDCALKGM